MHEYATAWIATRIEKESADLADISAEIDAVDLELDRIDSEIERADDKGDDEALERLDAESAALEKIRETLDEMQAFHTAVLEELQALAEHIAENPLEPWRRE